MSSLQSSNLQFSTPVKNDSAGSSTPPTNKQLLAEDKKSRRTSLQVILPKLPSSDSLNFNNSPPSPGISVWNEHSPRIESALNDRTIDSSKLNRKESYKAQRKTYRKEKKRVASELLNSLQDPAIIVLADWLKVRGTLKSWTKLYFILKPGLMLLYKSPKVKSSHWIGTVLLTSCQVIERPSKKDGFCFKLFHPLDQSIWAPRGPDKETIGAVVQPLPTSYLIFRAPSQAAGKCWMDALELSLRCSALLVRTVSSNATPDVDVVASGTSTHETQWSEADYEKHFDEHGSKRETLLPLLKFLPINFLDTEIQKSSKNIYPNSPCPSPTPLFQQLYLAVANWDRLVADTPDSLFKLPPSGTCFSDESLKDTEVLVRNRRSSLEDVGMKNEKSRKIFRRKSSPANLSEEMKAQKSILGIAFNKENLDMDDTNSHIEGNTIMSAAESESDSDICEGALEEYPETSYVHTPENDEFGAAGEQVEELMDENKSLIWILVKQVRPGMDLSRVVLPTFILEPRSFLEKLADSYYHVNYLSDAVQQDDPFTRMKLVVKWYLSGFYKKPKGLKKPYNPILGETFRCYWQHENGSRTFYIAEQVSHHPAISAFYVTNREDGFCISCSLLARSKFYGNSTSAILDGVATVTLLPRGENYTLQSPYAYCKGILLGTLSMELGGKVSIDCENTGYHTELEFKLKPFLGGSEYTNLVTGRLKLGKQTMATINGHWDGSITIKDSRSGEEQILFAATPEVRAKRLKRYTVTLDTQSNNESERLWQHVSAAIRSDDQIGATEEKTALEEAQRASAKERKAMCSEWVPAHFQQDLVTGQYIYKSQDLRPWDVRNDLKQYESNFIIQTKTKHQAPIVRTSSIISGEPMSILKTESRSSLAAARRVLENIQKKSTPKNDDINSDSSHSIENETLVSHSRLLDALDGINKKLDQQSKLIAGIQNNITRLQMIQEPQQRNSIFNMNVVSIIILALGVIFHAIFMWVLARKH